MYIFTRHDYRSIMLEQLRNKKYYRNIFYGCLYGMSNETMLKYAERFIS